MDNRKDGRPSIARKWAIATDLSREELEACQKPLIRKKR